MERLKSLDVFRGLTIAGMVLVNNPGSGQYIYPALGHAAWHGVTPTDLIFPFFLFIVGVAITLSMDKRLAKGDSKKLLSLHIFQRSVTIFLLGEFMSGFPFFNAKGMVAAGESYLFIGLLLLFSFCYNLTIIVLLYKLFDYLSTMIFKPENKVVTRKNLFMTLIGFLVLVVLFPVVFPDNGLSSIRIPGVLQRIAVVYLISSMFFLSFGTVRIIYVIASLLIIYTLFMLFYPVPGYGAGVLTKEGNFAAYLDNMILSGHMWVGSKTWDPEGIFSTLPAIATALFGVLTGKLLISKYEIFEKVSKIFFWGSLLSVLGVFADMIIPMNKNIWTSSFSLYCAGMAMLFLGVCIYMIDIKKYSKIFTPFLVYGMNAITVFFLSGMLARVMFTFKVNYAGESVNIQQFLYLSFFQPLLGSINGSLAYALFYVSFWLGLMWFLYSKKIFIKV